MVESNDTLGILHSRVSFTIVQPLNASTCLILFTRSLSDMTQERLEEIFAQYAQTMEAFQPLDDDDDDREADRIWEEHYMWGTNDDDDDEDDIRNASGSTMSEASTVFSQPHATMSSEMIHPSPFPPSPPVSLADKPLPKNPPIEDIPRRKSLTPSVRSRNRLSWTSDTGVALSGSMVQAMASDMMNLFDMNFSVDIKLNTAPKLPELPFPQQCQQRKRLSNDSLMGLIPTFETFTLDDDPPPHSSLSQKPKRKSRLSQSWSNSFVSDTSLNPFPSSEAEAAAAEDIATVPNPPTRSSSLAYRKHHQQQQQQRRASQPTSSLQNQSSTTKRSDFLAGLWGAAINGSNNNDKKETRNLSRSKSMRRLASLVRGNKKKASKSSPTLQYVESSDPPEPPVKEHLFNKSQHSLCSVASTTSSCSTSSVQVMVARKTSFRKPQQESLMHQDNDDDHLLAKRRSFTMLRPVVVEAQDLRRARSVGHSYRRRPLAVKMDLQKELPPEPQPTLSRSKSTLKKLSRGLSQRRRRNKEEHDEPLPVQPDTKTTNTFVKRMTSLGRRIRLHSL